MEFTWECTRYVGKKLGSHRFQSRWALSSCRSAAVFDSERMQAGALETEDDGVTLQIYEH